VGKSGGNSPVKKKNTTDIYYYIYSYQIYRF
jgi:hypothetical protein